MISREAVAHLAVLVLTVVGDWATTEVQPGAGPWAHVVALAVAVIATTVIPWCRQWGVGSGRHAVE